MSTRVEKIRYLWKTETHTSFWDQVRVKYDKCYNYRKESVFQHFHTYFLHTFPIVRYFPTLIQTNEKFVFQVEIMIANTKSPDTCLLNILHKFFLKYGDN